ncbi:MAG TPA: XrtA/PEP-CTERM system TPR-repeat protein PrsT [Casimicrobiaceae bacterium]|nr:XrtA/PEP-CTERM system TPR-repeat protein PrsT [Casimicrobiaceae bacterium]
MGVAAVLALAACPHASAFNAEATKFYENAMTRYEKDDIAGAIIQLNNAIQKDPTMLAAHVLMGKLRLKNSDPANAEASFEKALQLGVDRAEVALPLAEAYAAQDKFDALLEKITPAGLPKQTQLEVLILRGRAYAEKGELNDAMRTFGEARALDALSIPVVLAQADVLLRMGQPARASGLVADAIKLAPNNSAAWNLRGSIAHIKGDSQAALADYAKAIELDPANLDARVARAGLLLDLGRVDDADKAIAEIRGISRREPRAAYLQAVVASRRNDNDAARAALTEAVGLIDPAPKRVVYRYGQLMLIGGLSHYGLGNMEKAAEYFVAYLKLHPNDPGPSKVLASIYLDRGDSTRATSLLEPLQQIAPNDPQLQSLLAAAYMKDKRYTLAVAALEKAVRLSGGAPDVRADFGVSLIAGGQSELGVAQLEQAFAKDPGQLRAGVALATLYLKRGQPKKAVEMIDPVARRNPRNVGVLNLQGVVHVAVGDNAGGRAAYQAALALNPRYRPAQLNLARLDLAEGKTDAARARLMDMLKADKNNGDAMIELARLEEQSGHLPEAIALLEKARLLRGQTVTAGAYLADLLLRQREPDKALAVAKDVASRAPSDFSALRARALAELAVGDNRNARQTLSVMAPLAGFDPEMNVEIARLQFAAGDSAAASFSLDKVLKDHPDRLPALALLAEVQIASGDLAKAEQNAKRIGERFPASGVGPRLTGDIAAVRGQYAAAIASYRIALDKNKSSDTALRIYGAYLASKEPAKGIAFLEQWSKANPDDWAALRVLADGQLTAGNLVSARAGYERLLKERGDDPYVLNNLAQVAIRQGDKAAVGYAERAYQRASTDPAIIDTLGWALVKNGQVERGTGLLRDARLRDSSNPDIRFHLAAALAAAGRDTEARSELRELLKEGKLFAELEDARKLQARLGP